MQQRASPGVSWTAGWEFGSEPWLDLMGAKLGQTGAAKRGDRNGDLQYVFYEIR